MHIRKSLVVLLVSLILVFAPAALNRRIGLVSNDDLIRATELAVALVGIFLGAYYELQNLERRLKEERKKEVRQQKLNILDYIEGWLNDVSSAIEDIEVLRELSEKDKSDGALLIPSEKWKPIAEKLLRLETRGFTVLAKLADIGDKELISKVALVWVVLETPRESFAKGIISGTQPMITCIADATQALSKVRIAELERD
jgi:hypothetical protein